VDVVRLETGAIEAAAISTWPFDPCSRRIAISGAAPFATAVHMGRPGALRRIEAHDGGQPDLPI